VTSPYLEGDKNESANWRYNRDGKKGKKQVVEVQTRYLADHPKASVQETLERVRAGIKRLDVEKWPSLTFAS